MGFFKNLDKNSIFFRVLVKVLLFWLPLGDVAIASQLGAIASFLNCVL